MFTIHVIQLKIGFLYLREFDSNLPYTDELILKLKPAIFYEKSWSTFQSKIASKLRQFFSTQIFRILGRFSSFPLRFPQVDDILSKLDSLSLDILVILTQKLPKIYSNAIHVYCQNTRVCVWHH